jgi:hypothetical protein
MKRHAAYRPKHIQLGKTSMPDVRRMRCTQRAMAASRKPAKRQSEGSRGGGSPSESPFSGSTRGARRVWRARTLMSRSSNQTDIDAASVRCPSPNRRLPARGLHRRPGSAAGRRRSARRPRRSRNCWASTVKVCAGNGHGCAAGYSARTDGNGHYTVRVVPGLRAATATVSARGHRTASTTVRLGSATTTANIALRLS